MIGEESGELFAPDKDYWPFEAWLSQIGWMRALGYEGGLFVTIGRRTQALPVATTVEVSRTTS
jgi:hypothetical protein